MSLKRRVITMGTARQRGPVILSLTASMTWYTGIPARIETVLIVDHTGWLRKADTIIQATQIRKAGTCPECGTPIPEPERRREAR